MATIESARAKYEAAKRRREAFEALLESGHVPDLKRHWRLELNALRISEGVSFQFLMKLKGSHGVQLPLLALEEMTG